MILRDIDAGRDEYNAVWEEWVNPAAMPVRICTPCFANMHGNQGVRCVLGGVMFEIMP